VTPPTTQELDGRCAVVTGGAHGIGRALAEALAEQGARVVVADIDLTAAENLADTLGGLAVHCDVAEESDVAGLVASATEAFGPVEVFCSNAGIADPADGLWSAPEEFRRIADINLFAHVWAARAVLPGMVERGRGSLLQTVSAAGLITGPMGPGYTLTKHGALGFAEWVALNYRNRGIHVTCLCPAGVWTAMTGHPDGLPDADTSMPDGRVPEMTDFVDPRQCAEVALRALAERRFLALPHPTVGDEFGAKARHYDAWLAASVVPADEQPPL
jgi:NAD(P)-dependent dehydrogenase (short-subunit alcohol dehydrogenase family)